MIWSGAYVIIIEITCTVNINTLESSWNYPPPPPQFVEKLSSMKPVLVPKRLEITGLKHCYFSRFPKCFYIQPGPGTIHVTQPCFFFFLVSEKWWVIVVEDHGLRNPHLVTHWLCNIPGPQCPHLWAQIIVPVLSDAVTSKHSCAHRVSGSE